MSLDDTIRSDLRRKPLTNGQRLIMVALRVSPRPASMSDLMAAVGLSYPVDRRIFQRQIAWLVERGLVRQQIVGPVRKNVYDLGPAAGGDE